LREIAKEVGVDVAYVHRSFGSKENLFIEVLKSLSGRTDLSETDPHRLASSLAKQLLAWPSGKLAGDVDPLLILVHSLTSPTAGPLVGQRLVEQFIKPVGAKLKDPARFRASMIISLLVGLSIFRTLLHIPAATKINPKDAEVLIAKAIEGIMGHTASSDSISEE
jgi:AcrR family transcriptional regulator